MSLLSRIPSRLRFAFFVFLGVYPLVTAAIYLLTTGWQVWQRNLVMVPIIVAAMVWLIIPTIQRRLSRFL